MFAKHPITGKDIRIVQLETSFSKDKKTLVWMDAAPQGEASAAWSRYDIGATSVAAATSLAANGLTPDVVLCDNGHDETLAWLQAGRAKSARIVAVSRAFVEAIGMERLVALRMGNLVCLDEIHDMYPFVGAAWDGTRNDAQVLIVMILQSCRSFPLEPSTRQTRGLTLLPTVTPPQPLWLITQYYLPATPRRRDEIEACLKANLDCDAIDRVVLLNEKACAPKHPKLDEHIIGKRLTYAAVLRWIYENVPKDTLVAFANADIFLDADSWRALWATDMETVPRCAALLRWDVESADAKGIKAAKLFGPRADSQDTWVVASNAVKAVTWDWAALDFPFGKGGCDNAITMEMFKKRFVVANPALTLKTYHLHGSGVRSYNPRDIVDKPAYLYIHPTGLHDKKPVMALDVLGKPTTIAFTPFERRLQGPLSVAQARTFCAMIARSTQNAITIEMDAPNTWSPPPVKVYPIEESFQTRDGLVYTHNSILVGPTKASLEAWSKSQISYLAASITVDSAVVAPLPEEVANSPARYMLEYLSKVFLLRKRLALKTGEFWCSKNPACTDTLRMFHWPSQEIPVLSREENQQVWCKAAAMWPYQDTTPTLVSAEEIGALRENLGLGGWKGEVTDKHLVIVVDQKWISDEVAEGLEAGLEGVMGVKVVWEGRSSLDTVVRSLRGAWGIVTMDKIMGAWSWVLPRGGHVWEVQSEMEPSALLLDTAAAAGLEHRMTIVPKGAPNAAEQKALVKKLVAAISAAVNKAAVAEQSLSPPPSLPSGKPKLILPHGHNGFYSHAGDSFRETAALWAERGYVDCVKSSTAHQVWLGDIGKVLLYDRPTYEWLRKAPAAERKWELALFGNPVADAEAAEAPANTVSPWSFWPRRPALVEAAVAKGLPSRSWESRTQSLVFYGRSENAVQKKRRSGSSWAAPCSEFVHVDGLKPYPFTQEQYLEKLADARYGLCLAGYGYKCHREVECMAMGCVPVVAPEVDMANYADPPEEGLHYLRAANSDDIPAILEKITAERWTVMSAACRDWWARNASVDGMWELTKRLAVPSGH